MGGTEQNLSRRARKRLAKSEQGKREDVEQELRTTDEIKQHVQGAHQTLQRLQQQLGGVPEATPSGGEVRAQSSGGAAPRGQCSR